MPSGPERTEMEGKKKVIFLYDEIQYSHNSNNFFSLLFLRERETVGEARKVLIDILGAKSVMILKVATFTTNLIGI